MLAVKVEVGRCVACKVWVSIWKYYFFIIYCVGERSDRKVYDGGGKGSEQSTNLWQLGTISPISKSLATGILTIRPNIFAASIHHVTV